LSGRSRSDGSAQSVSATRLGCPGALGDVHLQSSRFAVGLDAPANTVCSERLGVGHSRPCPWAGHPLRHAPHALFEFILLRDQADEQVLSLREVVEEAWVDHDLVIHESIRHQAHLRHAASPVGPARFSVFFKEDGRLARTSGGLR